MSFIVYIITKLRIITWRKRISYYIFYDDRNWERYITVIGPFKIRLIVKSQLTISSGFDDPIDLDFYYKNTKLFTCQNYREYSYDPYVPKLRSYLYLHEPKKKYITSSIFDEKDASNYFDKVRALKISLIRKEIELID